MNLRCSVPEPTLEQCRAFLKKHGLSHSASRRGPEGLWSVWTYPGQDTDREITLYEGSSANWSEYVAGWIEDMAGEWGSIPADEWGSTPEEVYRGIMQSPLHPKQPANT